MVNFFLRQMAWCHQATSPYLSQDWLCCNMVSLGHNELTYLSLNKDCCNQGDNNFKVFLLKKNKKKIDNFYWKTQVFSLAGRIHNMISVKTVKKHIQMKVWLKFDKSKSFHPWKKCIRNVVCQMAANLCLPPWVNSSSPSGAYRRQWIGLALVQIMACRLFGAKPLSKPKLGYNQLDP